MAYPALRSNLLVRWCVLLFGLAGLSVAVSGCSTSPGGPAAFAAIATQPPAAAGITANPTLTAVTTRSAVKGAKAKPWFGTQRANQPSNVRIHLSSPDDG